MMKPTTPPKKNRPLACFRRLAATLLLIVGAVVVLLQLYLLSPLATSQAASLLSRTLNRPVRLDGLRLTSAGIELRGVRIANDPFLRVPWLLQVQHVTILPAWREWLRGKRSVHAVLFQAPKMHLARTANGEWNLQQLLRALPKAEKPGPEVRIGRLQISNGSIAAPDTSLQQLSLEITDLYTRGSHPLTYSLSARDPHGATLSATGTAQLGPRPIASATLNLTTPLHRLARPASRLALDRGIATAQVRVALANGLLTGHGDLAVAGAALRTRGGERAVKLHLRLHGDYALTDDLLRLTTARLDLDGLATLAASGTVADLRGDRRFTVDLSLSPLDLSALRQLAPLPAGLEVKGAITEARLRLGGGRHGIDAGSGRFRLRGIGISRSGTPLLSDATIESRLEQRDNDWLFSGKLDQPPQSLPLIRSIQLPFRLALDRSFRIRSATGKAQLNLANTSVTGEVNYQPTATTPVSGNLQAPAIDLAALAPLLRPHGFTPTGGRLGVDLSFRGTTGSLTGSLALRGNELTANAGTTPLALRRLETSLAINYRRNTLASLRGTILGEGGRLRQTDFALDSKLDLAQRRLRLRDLRLALGSHRLTAANLDYQINNAASNGITRRLPLQLSANGIVLAGNSGPLLRDAELATDLELQQTGAQRRLAGTARLSAASWLLRGSAQGPITLLATSGQGQATVQFRGGLLGGELHGTATMDPLDLGQGLEFGCDLTGADLVRLDPLLPAGRRQIVTGGELRATAKGSYLPASGLRGDFSIDGSKLGFALPNGKSLMHNATAHVVGTMTPERLSLPTLQLTLGPELQLAGHGELTSPLSPGRSGSFTLLPADTPLGAWLDAFANLLPRQLQEATAEGRITLGAHGGFTAGRSWLDGRLTLRDGGLDLPGQKLRLAGINGTLPVSLATGSQQAPPQKPRHRRGDYPALLAELRRPGEQGEAFVIDTISFGPLLLGPTRMTSQSTNGRLVISDFNSVLLGGQLRGRGSVTLGSGMRYEADLLVHDLSLRQLCAAFPTINGYLTGRVDGMVGLLGTGAGLEKLAGTVDLWTRAGNGEGMLISREFLQKLAGKKLKGYFFRDDRPYDRGEIAALLQQGYLTFDTLDISHTTLGIRDLSVSVAAVQNRIALDHLFGAIKAAAERGKASKGSGKEEAPPPIETEFKWAE